MAGTAGVRLGRPYIDGATDLKPSTVKLQATDNSCASACGAIISEGALTEAELMERITLPGGQANVGDLAHELGGNWQVKSLSQDDTLSLVSEQTSPFVAELKRVGADAHAVVVEPLGEGVFRVIDTGYGGSYVVTGDQLAEYSRTVLHP